MILNEVPNITTRGQNNSKKFALKGDVGKF